MNKIINETSEASLWELIGFPVGIMVGIIISIIIISIIKGWECVA